MKKFIENMLKVEFYVYIEGILEFELSFVLVQKNNVLLKVKIFEEMIKVYDFYDLFFFFDIYYVGMSVLIEEDDFYQFIMVYFKRVVVQNIVYVEFFFDF